MHREDATQIPNRIHHMSILSIFFSLTGLNNLSELTLVILNFFLHRNFDSQDVENPTSSHLIPQFSIINTLK